MSYAERNNYEIVASLEATRISNVPDYTDGLQENTNVEMTSIWITYQ